jgi:hypothetical protein
LNRPRKKGRDVSKRQGAKQKSKTEEKPEKVVVELLDCRLTREEKEDRSKQLVARLDALDKAKDDFKTIQSDYGAEKKALERDIKHLQNALHSGMELRRVEVGMFADANEGSMTYVRQDTGEVIRKRALTVEERQRPLPLKSGKKGEEAEGA